MDLQGPHISAGRSPRSTRFPKAARLLRSADFRRVQGRGKRIRTRHLLVLWSGGRGEGSRFGLVVSRKVGKAVTRNRVKRWLREAIRRNRWRLEGRRLDVAVIASPRAAEAGLLALEQDLLHALERLPPGGAP